MKAFRWIERSGKLQVMVRMITPTRTAFIGSLLLSFVAIQGQLVNRDGVLYLDIARTILEEGLQATVRIGDLGFLPMLIAAVSVLSRLGLESSAHLLNALFLAGTCALLVSWSKQRAPETAWAACLVVLAMPAYNHYRSDILREYGFWFFSIAGLWLAMRWSETQRWRELLLSQLALATAALFRLEAITFFPALMLWQAFSTPDGQKSKRILATSALPLSAVGLVTFFLAIGALELPGRAIYYLQAANPIYKLQLFNEAAVRFADAVLNKYSREGAAYILFFGLLTVIPMKFFSALGIFVVPTIYQFLRQPIRETFSRWQPLGWAFLFYLLVLAAFLTHQFFLSARYVSMLNLLMVPMIAAGSTLLLQRYPRWRVPMVLLALLVMLVNVVSWGPRKTHIIETGQWLAKHAPDHSKVCMTNPRIAYYADWPVRKIAIVENLDGMLAMDRCGMVVLEINRKDEKSALPLSSQGFHEAARFENSVGDVVLVAVRN